MTSVTKKIIDMLDMLPEKEQEFACEVLRKLFLEWYPFFQKITPAEALRISEAKKEFEYGQIISHNEIEWK
jgi:hypothetical protein